ncbi:hypothetical protein Y032_0051g2145 [Ancylostoma ceylanicum]|nr:hypothetical protein Y032_0051g2145 [Ancylostoma ceylanicum]
MSSALRETAIIVLFQHSKMCRTGPTCENKNCCCCYLCNNIDAAAFTSTATQVVQHHISRCNTFYVVPCIVIDHWLDVLCNHEEAMSALHSTVDSSDIGESSKVANNPF